MSNNDLYPTHAPGWQAIDSWVGSRFAGQTPHQFTSKAAYDLQSSSPLPGITVWETESPKAWLFVSYGLSELFEKNSEDEEISGFGFELTMRLPRYPSEQHPPVWVLQLIQALGHQVLSTRTGFDSGHCIDLGGTILPQGESRLEGLACVPDPLLGKLDGPFGTLLFLQMVGVTRDELELMKDWEMEAVVGAIAEIDAEGLTLPGRSSWLEDEQKARVMRRYKVGLKL